MWLLWWILKTALDVTIKLPVSIVSDVFTLWWTLTDDDPKTSEAIKDIIDDLDELI